MTMGMNPPRPTPHSDRQRATSPERRTLAAGLLAAFQVTLLTFVIAAPVRAADSATRRATAKHPPAAGDHATMTKPARSNTAEETPAAVRRRVAAASVKHPAAAPPPRHAPGKRASYANGAACALSGAPDGARHPSTATVGPHSNKPRSTHARSRRHFMGVASYYGPGFTNRPTANGERFDPRAMTAAHRTLPFGTRVRVTNLENGRQVVVRINDRGPYRKGRVLDLSRAAARKLGFVDDGVAHVRVEVLKDKKSRRERLTDDMQASSEGSTRTRSKARA